VKRKSNSIAKAKTPVPTNVSADGACAFNSQELRTFCQALLLKAGLDSNNAYRVADSLVHANLRGIDSHGIARLPHYLSRIAHGSINPKPAMQLQNLSPSCARLDGDHALGQLVMWRAAADALSLARETGAGWVSICNSTHCGALDYFGLKIARTGMIGLVFTHVDPMVLPFGARAPFCGTNPICITAPGEDENILCLDMATSKVPWNKVTNAALDDEEIELGLAVDVNGHDTIDPKKVAALYPLGDYKGSGLGLMIDVLCSMLSDAPYGPDIPKMYGDLSQRRRLGGLVGAIDISRFIPLKRFKERASELMRRWNNLPPVGKGGQVLYPGQIECNTSDERLSHGIPLPEHLVKTFNELAASYGLKERLRPRVVGAVDSVRRRIRHSRMHNGGVAEKL
jgi:ureidoglycolate dehydrogenase (NAD+)